MPVKVGANTPTTFKVGNSQVDKIFLGTDVVWPETLSVSVTDQLISDDRFAGDPLDAFAGYSLNSNGVAYRSDSHSGDTAISGDWRISGASSDYEVRATRTGGVGTVIGSGFGTWLSLGTSRSWEIVSPTGTSNAKSATITIEVRSVSTGVVIDSGTIVIQSTWDYTP